MISAIHQAQAELAALASLQALGRPPSVTVAILSRNSLSLIKSCCESIVEKVRYPSLAILVADTGSTDEAVWRFYRDFGARCAADGIEFHVNRLSDYDFGGNYNQIVSGLTTEFVLIQNNDTIAINDYVTAMMSVAIFRKAGSVGCRMLYADGRIQHDGQAIFSGPGGAVGEPTHVHLGWRPHQVAADEQGTVLVDGNTAAGVLLRVSEFKAIGGFDEHYRDVYQDVDLMIRIPRALGKANYCNRRAMIIHLDNASRLEHGRNERRLAQMAVDREYLYSKAIENNWSEPWIPNKVRVSAITWVTDTDEYRHDLQSILDRCGEASIEFIGIPGFCRFCAPEILFETAVDLAAGQPWITRDAAGRAGPPIESLLS